MASSGPSGDDEEGFLVADVGATIPSPAGHTYELIQELGGGSYARVYRARISSNGEFCALKIQRSGDDYTAAAKHEAQTLTLLRRESSPNERDRFLQIYEAFSYSGHVCIVSELLGPDIYRILKGTEEDGLPIPVVRGIARDLFEALRTFKLRGIVHCDLKPENLVEAGRGSHVKVIDFGQARHLSGLYDGEIQTIFYRAPENVLRLPYGCPIDMWSAGCILVEAFTRVPLFAYEEEFHLLEAHVKFLGNIPPTMAQKSVRQSEFFRSDGKLKSQEEYCADQGVELDIPEYYVKESTVRAVIMKHVRMVTWTAEQLEAEAADRAVLADLLEKILVLEPERRILPEAALDHPFITAQFSGS